MREISGSQLADLTGKTWRTVKSLLETAGVQPKRRDGRSDLYDSTVALRAIYAPESSAEFDDQRQRLAAAQSEKVEHENALRRGQLAARVDVERFWTECIANARAKALSMSSKLSPRLVNIGDAGIIAAAIRAEVYAFLAELADYEPSERGGMDPVGEPGVGAAAGTDGGRVGRPRKTAVNGVKRRTRAVENG